MKDYFPLIVVLYVGIIAFINPAFLSNLRILFAVAIGVAEILRTFQTGKIWIAVLRNYYNYSRGGIFFIN